MDNAEFEQVKSRHGAEIEREGEMEAKPKRARHWKALQGEALAGIYPALGAMTDAELRVLIKAPARMTQTNCWWLAYRTAPLLAEIAKSILRSRKVLHKQPDPPAAPPTQAG